MPSLLRSIPKIQRSLEPSQSITNAIVKHLLFSRRGTPKKTPLPKMLLKSLPQAAQNG